MGEVIRHRQLVSDAVAEPVPTDGLRADVESYTWVETEEMRPGARGLWLRTTSVGHEADAADPHGGGAARVYLTADALEHLGIHLQICASFARGSKPPAGPEDDRTPGPTDVPLTPDHEHEESTHGR